jgi:ABC-type branched-subunit amino acid transport system substrate-binding protein
LDLSKVKLLGTGLWDDPGTSKEALLVGGWFAAPDPEADAAFVAKYRSAFGGSPYQSQLAGLAYDAISLVALLGSGEPYHRFTRAALTDPNGFAGVDGIFRLNMDGTAERGLAVLAVAPNGKFDVIDPAPKTFQRPAS